MASALVAWWGEKTKLSPQLLWLDNRALSWGKGAHAAAVMPLWPLIAALGLGMICGQGWERKKKRKKKRISALPFLFAGTVFPWPLTRN